MFHLRGEKKCICPKTINRTFRMAPNMPDYRVSHFTIDRARLGNKNWQWSKYSKRNDLGSISVNSVLAECIARGVPEFGLLEQLEHAANTDEKRLTVAGMVGLLGELVALASLSKFRMPKYIVKHPQESNATRSGDWLFSTLNGQKVLSVEVKAKGWPGANFDRKLLVSAFEQAGWGAAYSDDVDFIRMCVFVRLRKKNGKDEWDIAFIDLDDQNTFQIPNFDDVEKIDFELAEHVGKTDPILGHSLACWAGENEKFLERYGRICHEFLTRFEGEHNPLRDSYEYNQNNSDGFRNPIIINGKKFDSRLRQKNNKKDPEDWIRVDHFRVLIPSPSG